MGEKVNLKDSEKILKVRLIHSNKFGGWYDTKNDENGNEILCDKNGEDIFTFKMGMFTKEVIEYFLDVYLLGFHRGKKRGIEDVKIKLKSILDG